MNPNPRPLQEAHCASRQPIENGSHPVCRQPVYLEGRCWTHYWSAQWPLPLPGLPETPDPDWRERAACKGMDVELFFLGKGERPPPEVVEACAGCPVRGDCLVEELEVSGNHQHGVFGGVAPSARIDLRRRMKRMISDGHGSRAGYQRHLRDDQEPCEACRDANAAYHAERRAS